MLSPISVGDRADDVGQLLLDPLVDRLAHPRRQVVPQLRVLALHDPLDQVADVVARAWRGCARRSSRARAARRTRFGLPSLAIPLSTAIEPIFAAREGTIPCQPIPPCMTPGTCWILRGQQPGDRRRGRAPDARKRTG